MIPSSPRRTWLFLLISCALFFGPDLLAPAAWSGTVAYRTLSTAYQGLLVILGFWLGPAICRALVVRRVNAGPVHEALEAAVRTLGDAGWRPAPITLADHPMPFVLTAGLLPSRVEVFLSSGLARRLSEPGLRFLLARALAHGSWPHRLADVLPVLAFTVWVPDEPAGLGSWLALAVGLLLWLALHWAFELAADRRAGRVLGSLAASALREVETATRTPLSRLIPHPPLRWRIRAVGLDQTRHRVTKAS
jgi:Zn-dependent protease with chaperone function